MIGRTVYRCRACARDVEPEREGRSEMIRNGQVLLTCGHTAHPGAGRVILEGDADLSPEAEEQLWARLEAKEWRR